MVQRHNNAYKMYTGSGSWKDNTICCSGKSWGIKGYLLITSNIFDLQI